jgi:hypothetical protein
MKDKDIKERSNLMYIDRKRRLSELAQCEGLFTYFKMLL